MVNPIVIVNVTQTIAPTPSTLQKTGALISQGGTTLTAGTYSLLTQESDLTPLLASSLALTSLSWAGAFGGQVTATTAAAHGIPVNEQFVTTIAGAVPDGYNRTVVATATGASTFTYFLADDPGTETSPGTYTPKGVGEIKAMASTFFAQGAQQGVYVLELGDVSTSAAVTALDDFITTNGQFFYSYLVPRSWDGDSDFLTYVAQYESTTSKTYFFVTTTLQNYGLYNDQMKCVVALVEAPRYGTWSGTTISAATWLAGEVTATTAAAHGIAPGDYFKVVGVTPATYNGTFVALPGTTGTTLVYGVTDNPGSYVSGGTIPAQLYSSDGVPPLEFTHAADFWVTLNYNPSTTNKVTPFTFAYLYGVTRFPTQGNAAVLAQLKAANINYVSYGAEGGISNNMLVWGHTLDGRPFNYWYSVDWMQINVDLAISNAVINGSNDPINPLYYNQDGINRLEQVAARVGSSAISYGLALGTVTQVSLDGPEFQNNLNAGKYAGNVVVNAIPFVNYTATNPGDYKIGKYAGLSMVYTPLRGFEQIIFNINVTDFVAA